MRAGGVRGRVRVNLVIWVRSQWDRLAGFALIAAGAVAIVLGYLGVSDSPYVADEIAYVISGGIGGLFLLAVGAALLISADLHDEWRKLDHLEDALRRATQAPTTTGATNGATSGNGGTPPAGISGRTALLARANAIRSSALWPGNGTHFSSARFRRAQVLAAAGLLACLGAIIGGWNHAAGVADPDPAIDAVGIAVGALIAAGFVVALYTLWLKRAVHSRMARLLGPIALAEFIAELPAAATVPTSSPAPVDEAPTLVGASSPPERSRRRARSEQGKTGIATDADRRPFAYVQTSPSTVVVEPPPPAERVWVADELGHFHRAGCALLRGTNAREIERSDADPKLVPCGICQA